jgi:hypothetical protein
MKGYLLKDKRFFLNIHIQMKGYLLKDTWFYHYHGELRDVMVIGL